MAGNSNLDSAKKAKNDEFYTQISDIEKELKHYRHHCSADDIKLSFDYLLSDIDSRNGVINK